MPLPELEAIVNEIFTIILSAALGGAGCVGLVFFFIRYYIEKRIKKNEEAERENRDIRIKKRIIDEEREQATGRLLFWIVRAIQTGTHNGELESAHQRFQEVEQKAKDFDRSLLAKDMDEVNQH